MHFPLVDILFPERFSSISSPLSVFIHSMNLWFVHCVEYFIVFIESCKNYEIQEMHNLVTLAHKILRTHSNLLCDIKECFYNAHLFGFCYM